MKYAWNAFPPGTRCAAESAMRIVALHRPVRNHGVVSEYFRNAGCVESIPNGHFSRMLFLWNTCWGYDGGGTKTECVLMDSAGESLGVGSRAIQPDASWSGGGEGEIEKAAELRCGGWSRAKAVVALGAGWREQRRQK